MRRWWLGAGGNLGDVGATLTRATAALRTIAHDVQLSRLYWSVPVGANAGARFVNAAIGLSTDLAPLDLLNACQGIEDQCGRTRTLHWGPRTLALDLLLTDDGLIVDHPRLTLPHPHFWYRRFVLEPLADIAPDVMEPRSSRTIREWLAGWQRRPIRIGYPVKDAAATALRDHIEQRFPEVQLVPADSELAGSLLTMQFAPILSPQLSPGSITLPQTTHLAEPWLVDFLTAATDAPTPL